MLEILSVFSTVQCSCIYIGAQHAESATRVHTGPKARWGLLGLYTTHKAYITKLVCVDGIEWQSPPSVLICSGNPCVVNILSTCGTTAAALQLHWCCGGGWVCEVSCGGHHRVISLSLLRLRLRQVYSTQNDIIQMHDIRHTWQFLCIIQY